jgi:hypothetical protein
MPKGTTVPGSITASSDKVKSERQLTKQYKKNQRERFGGGGGIIAVLRDIGAGGD